MCEWVISTGELFPCNRRANRNFNSTHTCSKYLCKKTIILCNWYAEKYEVNRCVYRIRGKSTQMNVIVCTFLFFTVFEQHFSLFDFFSLSLFYIAHIHFCVVIHMYVYLLRCHTLPLNHFLLNTIYESIMPNGCIFTIIILTCIQKRSVTKFHFFD